MRLSTRMHGFVDYVLAAALIALPWILGFGQTRAGWAAMLFGVAILVNGIITNFESGRVRVIEVPVHLWIDGVLGLLLILSPWLFTFDRTAWIPHAAAGALVILAALVTNTIPDRDRRGGARGVG